MELKAYSIRDSKGEVFNVPFFKRSHGEAERDFTTLVNDPQSQVSKFPEDYDLWYLGVYDDLTGKFSAEASPQHVVKAVTVKQSVQ